MSNTHKGILCLLTSVFCFALMDVFVHYAGDIPVLQKSFFRNLVSLTAALSLLLKEGKPLNIQKKNIPFHFLRSFAGTLAVLCNFYAVDHMLLSEATVLMKLSPFFTIIFSFLILKEKTGLWQWLCVAAAFLGSLLVIRPSASGFANPAAFSALAAGLCSGFAYTMVRLMGLRGERGPVIIFIFSAFSCLVALPSIIFSYTPMTAAQCVYLALVGLSAAGGQFAITAAYRFAPANQISVFEYLAPVFAGIMAYFCFGQVSDLQGYLGYGVILCAGICMFLYNTGRLKPPAGRTPKA